MSQKIKSLFISCSDSVKCCDRAQYDEATIFEKLKIHIHNTICKACREYTRKNVKLTKLIKKSNLKACTKEEKENWEKEIERETKK